MPQTTFCDRLVKETEGQRQTLYATPPLALAMTGRIGRRAYIAYLSQAYHHVRHTVPFLMAMGARLPDEKAWLRKVIVEYLKEEIGHEEWILNDIGAAGGDVDGIRNSRPHRETDLMIAWIYDYIARKNPVGFLGMVFMLESSSVEIAVRAAESIKLGTGLPQTAFSYLTSHGVLDVDHMAFLRGTLNRIEDVDDQAAIIEVARNAFLLFAAVIASIPTAELEQGESYAA